MVSRANQLTIGRLARAADVGIETIRYYQSIGLIPTPAPTGAYRYYPATLVDRVRFVKRGQQLGLSLTEIAELIRLNDGAHRASIRNIAKRRLAEIELRIDDLQKIQAALTTLVNRCAHTRATLPCPIIQCLTLESTETNPRSVTPTKRNASRLSRIPTPNRA